MARKKYDMINEVMAHFDFVQTQLVMMALNWKWAGSKEVPTIRELKEEAENHLNSAIEQALSPNNIDEHHEVGWISASGGFKATAWKNEDNTLARIQLEFIVADWDADDSEPAE